MYESPLEMWSKVGMLFGFVRKGLEVGSLIMFVDKDPTSFVTLEWIIDAEGGIYTCSESVSLTFLYRVQSLDLYAGSVIDQFKYKLYQARGKDLVADMIVDRMERIDGSSQSTKV